MKPLVVITGASSGFGRAMAIEFNKVGYPLLLIARRIEKLLELNLENTICAKVDVADKAAFEAAVRSAEEKYGLTDLIINNAGVMLLGDIATQDPEEWKTMLDVNVIGVMNGMQIVMNDMKAREHGTIINISSVAGVNAYGNHAAYSASKFGVCGLSEVARMELSPYNVRVIRMLPGAVATELLGHTTSDAIKDNYMDWVKATGVGSIKAEDVARTARFVYEMPQGVIIKELHITDTKQDR
ncbi:MAG: SDR family oxidoreductase [Clostridiales bacterium]|nr:SDR family oxidoreductase [Clostridiales bacterium]